jgi:hypothetical protein
MYLAKSYVNFNNSFVGKGTEHPRFSLFCDYTLLKKFQKNTDLIYINGSVELIYSSLI